MKAWLGQHGAALRDALSRFAQDLLPTSLNVLVIGIALALPASVYLGVKNFAGLVREVRAEPVLTLYLALESAAADIEAVGMRLRRHPDVAGFKLVSRDEALEQLKRTTELAGVVDALGRNPLPDAYVVTAKARAPEALETLRAEAARWPKVDNAELDAEWLRKVHAGVAVGRGIATVLAGLLAAALAAVTFNTIRLQILTRQAEIEVSKLIGATDAYVRRPFLYHGALQGLAGGATACVIVNGAATLLTRSVGTQFFALGGGRALEGLGPVEIACLLGASAALGWLGAALSVWSHLRQYH